MKPVPWRLLGMVFGSALVVNIVWEFTQMPLYRADWPFAVHAPMCLRASLFDAAFTLGLYVLCAFMHRSWRWSRRMQFLDIMLVVLLGFATATVIEWHALATGRWGYGPQMPLVPILRVGLTPFLQLAVLSLLTFFCIGWIKKRRAAATP